MHSDSSYSFSAVSQFQFINTLQLLAIIVQLIAQICDVLGPIVGQPLNPLLLSDTAYQDR
jgi:hypothetical protein